MILLPRSQTYSDPFSTDTNYTNAFLQDQLKPRDSGLGAFPDSSNILIALGVIIGLAAICLIANFGLIRWGHRPLFTWLCCCLSRRDAEESDSAASSGKTRKARVLKKPKIYDVSLDPHDSVETYAEHPTWRDIKASSPSCVRVSLLISFSSSRSPFDIYVPIIKPYTTSNLIHRHRHPSQLSQLLLHYHAIKAPLPNDLSPFVSPLQLRCPMTLLRVIRHATSSARPIFPRRGKLGRLGRR